jgi:hypothetical protein
MDAPSEDYVGNPRPAGGGYDIGAYEFQMGVEIGKKQKNSLPGSAYLMQNYPNPFNPVTCIPYSLLKTGHVDIDIVDVSGRKVRTLISENKAIGEYHVIWNGLDNEDSPISSGVYFYRMTTEGFTKTRKLLLLR